MLSSVPQWELNFINRPGGYAARHFHFYSLLHSARIWSRWDQHMGKQVNVAEWLSSVCPCNLFQQWWRSGKQFCVDHRHSSCWNISVDLNRILCASFKKLLKCTSHGSGFKWKYRTIERWKNEYIDSIKLSNCFIFYQWDQLPESKTSL